VINSAQTPTGRASYSALEITSKRLQGEFQMVTEMLRLSPARPKSGYFGVITIVLIVAVGLCWGFAHM